jgi:hypothetical protein
MDNGALGAILKRERDVEGIGLRARPHGRAHASN